MFAPEQKISKKSKLQSKKIAPGQNFSRKKQNFRAKLLPLGQKNDPKNKKYFSANFEIFALGDQPPVRNLLSLFLSLVFCLLLASLSFSRILWASGPLGPPTQGPPLIGDPWPKATGPLPGPVRSAGPCRCEKLNIPIPRSYISQYRS